MDNILCIVVVKHFSWFVHECVTAEVAQQFICGAGFSDRPAAHFSMHLP